MSILAPEKDVPPQNQVELLGEHFDELIQHCLAFNQRDPLSYILALGSALDLSRVVLLELELAARKHLWENRSSYPFSVPDQTAALEKIQYDLDFISKIFGR